MQRLSLMPLHDCPTPKPKPPRRDQAGRPIRLAFEEGDPTDSAFAQPLPKGSNAAIEALRLVEEAHDLLGGDVEALHKAISTTFGGDVLREIVAGDDFDDLDDDDDDADPLGRTKFADDGDPEGEFHVVDDTQGIAALSLSADPHAAVPPAKAKRLAAWAMGSSATAKASDAAQLAQWALGAKK